jgi:kynurenine formamidase
MTEGQKEMLRSEGMTLSSNVEINGRSMISVLSIMTHNGTHIDAPRHMIERGFPVDQLPLARSGHPYRLDRQDVGQARVLGADALS